MTINNGIVWGNTPQQIYVDGGSSDITYSNIQGGWAGVGNININPLFVGGGNYHLQPTSPCIDSGDPNFVPESGETDIDGDQRVMDSNGDGIERIDMGADEVIYNNQPPYPPSNPYPENGTLDVSVNTDLSWTGGDPDQYNQVTYDVYFGITSLPTKVEANQSATTYNPGTLNYETTYYWKIVAWDNHGASNTSELWDFTTEDEPPIPDLDCDGSLSWIDVKPGATVEGSFTVENIGDPNSLLDWEIESYPDWGTWTFDPESGVLADGDSITVEVEVVAPDDPETEFEGEIKVVNSEDPDDFCIIQASLVTPVNHHSIFSRIVQLLEKFIDRFPLLERIFEQISQHYINL